MIKRSTFSIVANYGVLDVELKNMCADKRKEPRHFLSIVLAETNLSWNNRLVYLANVMDAPEMQPCTCPSRVRICHAILDIGYPSARHNRNKLTLLVRFQ